MDIERDVLVGNGEVLLLQMKKNPSMIFEMVLRTLSSTALATGVCRARPLQFSGLHLFNS